MIFCGLQLRTCHSSVELTVVLPACTDYGITEKDGPSEKPPTFSCDECSTDEAINAALSGNSPRKDTESPIDCDMVLRFDNVLGRLSMLPDCVAVPVISWWSLLTIVR